MGGFAKGLDEYIAEVGLNRMGFRLQEGGTALGCNAMNVVKVLNKEEVVTTFEWNLCNRIWRLVKLEWEV
ncbi:hypothetical protein P8452_45864 [Trifolium repens]|jgi:hypothetical protein|nr:hypothetical protein P8452_45864 [Trifolium repens]